MRTCFAKPWWLPALSVLMSLAWGCVHSQPRIGLEPFATGMNNPVDIKSAGDSRLFIAEQDGYIVILDSNGAQKQVPFLDIHERVVRVGSEQGLLGFVFHPQYASNGYFYVNYTGAGDSTHISRFSVSPSDPDSAVPGSEYRILTIFQPYQNHNGGELQFGPDGFLYIGLGDGGSAGDPDNRAQDLTQLLGKMLRIDVDGGNPYSIPPGNPFVQQPPARGEIWGYGLRNPWRFSFDRSTGDLWIADVGQGAFEEVDLQPSSSIGGENYGWRCYEGNSPYNTSGCPPPQNLVFPVYEYAHDASPCWSVTGGYVYRGSKYPGLAGKYFFADYCKDSLWTLTYAGGAWQVSQRNCFPGNNFSTFGENELGELFVAGHLSGTVFRITDTGPSGSQSDQAGNLIRVTPNPFSDRIKISAPAGGPVPSTGVISDVSGKVVLTFQFEGQETAIDTSPFKAGIYLMFIHFKNHREPAGPFKLVRF